MPVLTVAPSGVVPIGTSAVTATDNFKSGVLTTSANDANKGALAGGAAYSDGMQMTNAGQLIYKDATAGLPADTVWQNGLPKSSGALCISTDAAVTYSNGVPFSANGAVSSTVAP